MRPECIVVLSEPVRTFRGRVLGDHPDAEEDIESIEGDFPEFVNEINILARDYNAERRSIAASVDTKKVNEFYDMAMRIQTKHLGHLM